MNYQLFEAINNLAGHSNLLDIFMIDLSKYAPLLFALALGLYFIKAFKTHNKILLKQSTAAGVLLTLNLALSKLLGHFFFEARPFVDHTVKVLYYHIADASFPSDHAIGAMSIALGIYAINKKYGIIAIIGALLVGFSRIYVGHHYPLDIIGAFALVLLTYLLIQTTSIYKKISKTTTNITN